MHGPLEVDALRTKIFAGLAPIDDFAAAIGKTPRTIYNYIDLGLPVTYVGRTPYVMVDQARKWLLSRGRPKPKVLRRGRLWKAT